MAEYLRNCWYPAVWADAVPAGELFSRRILGLPLVFFRLPDGSVTALVDACPHRFAPLRLGTLLPDGRLQCGYHGLEFDGTGKCVNNPHGDGRIGEKAKVASFKVVEKHRMLWIWMGEEAPAEELIPDFSKLDSAAASGLTRLDHIVIEANYLYVVDNLLDLSHADYLHKGLLSSGDPDGVEFEVIPEKNGGLRMITRIRNAEASAMLKLLWKPEGGRGDVHSEMRWNAPASLLLKTVATEHGASLDEGTGIYGIHLLTPETDTTTHYSFAAIRLNPRSWGEEADARIRTELAEIRRFVFEQQDGLMIREQQKNMNDPALDTRRPLYLSNDVGLSQMRRALAQMIERERERRHDSNPQALAGVRAQSDSDEQTLPA